jgi:hypothetical protein
MRCVRMLLVSLAWLSSASLMALRPDLTAGLPFRRACECTVEHSNHRSFMYDVNRDSNVLGCVVSEHGAASLVSSAITLRVISPFHLESITLPLTTPHPAFGHPLPSREQGERAG